MQNHVSRFRDDESGAVTIDWVVLAAAVVGLALGTVTLVQNGLTDPANGIGAVVVSASTIDSEF